jgi:hypothetical protein
MACHFLQGAATSQKNFWASVSTQGPEGQLGQMWICLFITQSEVVLNLLGAESLNYEHKFKWQINKFKIRKYKHISIFISLN